MSKIKYIPEVDGLRALAVIPVIVYHLGLSALPGGFLGVDVFFVISGYLITAILLREVDKSHKRFFGDFYLRRLRRIFPAFFTVIATTLIGAYLVLLPDDHLELGRSALASVGFVSNIYFYFNTGYFDAPAESMALLHTWSLGVEEQFYLVWPGLILFLAVLAKGSRLAVVTILFLTSFIASFLVTPIDPPLAFFNLPFRIFQFLLGAAIPLFLVNTRIYDPGHPLRSAALQATGFSLTMWSFVAFSHEDTFPGWLAIFPSAGAALFIVGASLPDRPKLNPMKSRLAVGIGKISFSLYLWHWPIIILYKAYLGDYSAKLDGSQAGGLFLACLILSLLSYQLIERPFRKPHWQGRAIIYS